MRHFATLFDSKYLPQGLALYESLVKHSSKPFTLWVLALDNQCLNTLNAMGLLHVRVVNLPVLEILSPYSLESMSKSRTWQEYCWTLASQWCEFLMHEESLSELTYLDADMMFFSDPEFIFDEMGAASIAVIPHRLIPSKKHLEANGKFNVSWVTFRGDVGRDCVVRWAAQCRERCSAVVGCGDQLYLDEWPEKYGNKLRVIENEGAGLAPWNLANYQIVAGDAGGVLIVGEQTEDGYRKWERFMWVVFYHYHEYIHGQRWTNYALRTEDIGLIYKPYAAAVNAAKERIAELVTA